jgi:dTDP-4-dehydrorhamnose reductase
MLNPQHSLISCTHRDLDISALVAASQITELRPDLVIHPAAFTNVDACAREPDRALQINAVGTQHVALACQTLDIPLVYISTNEVFDGRGNKPYLEFDRPAPINAYAYSKWAGEVAVQQLLRKFYIVRVAWVFGGERNFVRTMLKLATERSELAVVNDEVGNPTYAPDIAQAIAQLIQHNAYGSYHFVNEGYCSRYDFAREIFRQVGRTDINIRPIKLADYKRDSTPPAFTPLRNFVGATNLGIKLPPWQEALQVFLKSIPQLQ